MIRKLTGMAIPLNNLRQWMLGLPGEANDFALDDQYRLSKLTYQQGGQTRKVDYGATATRCSRRCRTARNCSRASSASS